MKTIKETLVDMKQFLQDHNWIQKRLEDNKGGYCLLGALCNVESEDYPSSATYKFLCEHLQTPVGDLSSWNDAPGRTKDEVLAVLDQAIEKVS
jgi:hypothetical protein